MTGRAAPALLAAFAAGCHLVIDPEKVPRPSEVQALAAGAEPADSRGQLGDGTVTFQ